MYRGAALRLDASDLPLFPTRLDTSKGLEVAHLGCVWHASSDPRSGRGLWTGITDHVCPGLSERNQWPKGASALASEVLTYRNVLGSPIQRPSHVVEYPLQCSGLGQPGLLARTNRLKFAAIRTQCCKVHPSLPRISSGRKSPKQHPTTTPSMGIWEWAKTCELGAGNKPPQPLARDQWSERDRVQLRPARDNDTST